MTMSNLVRTTAAATLMVASMVASMITAVPSVSAAPVLDALALKNAVPSSVESVRWGGGWRGGGWRGGRGGWGVPLLGGLAAGALIGGALAAPYYYGPGPYYYPGPYYPAPAYSAPAYYGAPPDGAVAYCMQRFRSYDPNSGTYLGNDGYRHPCP